MLYLLRAAISELMKLAVPVTAALVVLAPALVILSNWWADQNEAHRVGLIPEGLNVSRTISHAYAGDQVPLPSANSNGLILYELQASTAQRITDGGSVALRNFLFGQGQKDDRFQLWNETPLALSVLSPVEVSKSETSEVTFRDIMRGWQPTADPELEQKAAGFLETPGNFYSFANEGRLLVIVAPEVRRVVYAFTE